MNINFDIKKKNLGVFAIFMILGLVIGYVGGAPWTPKSVSHDSTQIKVNVDGNDYDLEGVVNDLDNDINQLEIGKATTAYVDAATQTSFVYTVWGNTASCGPGDDMISSGVGVFGRDSIQGGISINDFICVDDNFVSWPYSVSKNSQIPCIVCIAD